MLADGRYDVLVVDAEPVPEQEGVVSLDLTILAGDAKGEVVSIRAEHLQGDPIDLMGLPGTLIVTAGSPALTLEG